MCSGSGDDPLPETRLVQFQTSPMPSCSSGWWVIGSGGSLSLEMAKLVIHMKSTELTKTDKLVMVENILAGVLPVEVLAVGSLSW